MPNIPEIKIGNTTYKLKDAELRRDIILAQNSQPTAENNRIWLQADSEDRQVPTWEEFGALKNSVDVITNTQIGFFEKGWFRIGAVGSTVSQDRVVNDVPAMSCIIPAQRGDTFIVKATKPGTTDARIYAELDSNMTVVDRLSSTNIDGEFTVSKATSAYIIINADPTFEYFLILGKSMTNRFKLRQYNNIFYIANNGSITWSKHGVSETTVVIGANNLILRLNNTSYTITGQSILNAAEESSRTSVDIETGSVTGERFCIAFDPDTQDVLILDAQQSNVSQYVILFACQYGSVKCGLIVDYMATKRIEALEEKTSSIENAMPEYYLSYMSEKIEQIKTNMMEVGRDGETIIFLTDIHWESNARKSPALVKHILKNTNVKVLMCGGDIINQGEKDAMSSLMMQAITSYHNEFAFFGCAFGNHDFNSLNQSGQTERFFDFSDAYALMQKQMEDNVTYFSSNKYDYYFDRVATKTRFIVIDTGIGGSFDRFGELHDVILDTPNGYHVIIIGHWFFYNGDKAAHAVQLESFVDACNSGSSIAIDGSTYDFTNAKCHISAVIGGHLHNDMSWYSPDGVPFILTDCDAGGRTENTDYPYVPNTTNEQCFDVFTLNYKTNSIKSIRIGRGINRAWSET